MSITRLFTVAISTGRRKGLVAALVALAALALAPSTAEALAVGVAMPADSVTVGQTGLTAHVTLTNDTAAPATVCGAGQCGGSEGIILIPSCASAAQPPPTCAAPDPGVFTFAPSALVAPGTCGTDPPTSFTISMVDAVQGKLLLAPQGGAVLLGAQGQQGASCDISLTFDVTKLPASDAIPDVAGLQTLQSASAQATPAAGGPTGGTGRDVTTVIPGTVVPPPVPPPVVVPPPIVPPPIVIPPPPPVIQPSDLDHFKCYEAIQPNFRRRLVGLRDQFGQRRARVLRTRQLCNPVSKNGGKVLQPRAHLVCYETRDTGLATPPRTVVVTNQFGSRKLTTTRPNRLCVPSLKSRTGTPGTTTNPTRVLDHFRCYDVKPQNVPLTVKLTDQFRTSATKILQVIRLCNPVRKNNEPVRRAKSHLVCYSIRDAQAFQPLGVRVRNQFGLASLRIRTPQTLCLPSFKQVVQTGAVSAAPPGLDHFKCYDADQPQLPVRFVGLRDQFGQSEGQVIATRQLCNPVSKNSGKVLNRAAHLVCYETPSVGTVPFQPREVRVSNQFGIRQLSVVKPATLCVPSLKRKGAGAAPTGANPTLVLDHFRCYDVKPQPDARIVKLVDQFKTSKTQVQRVVRLCNPVRKNNEVVRRPQAHLVCYSIAEAPFQPLAVVVRNQFGVAGIRVRRPSMLCLPSLKKLVTAAGLEVSTTASPL